MSLFLVLSFFTIASHCQSPHPHPLKWSNKAYGPDGPWQALSLGFGNPPQTIDAYPAGAWESLFFSPEICNHDESKPTCFAQEAGVYQPSDSSTSFKIAGAGVVNETFIGTQTLHGDAQYTIDSLFLPGDSIVPSLTIPNLSMISVTQGFRTLPNGRRYSAAVGNLALGAQDSNQSWGSVNGSLLTSYLYDRGVVPSSSYGLHIGSAALKIPGSLYVGGYDRLRVVGPVSAQAYGQSNLPIDLLDIGMGVAAGRSPFNFTSKFGLLGEGNSSLSRNLLVEVDPKEPYLYLPRSTCQSIASNLPVTYSTDLGLYLWNTADPLYSKIVSSPAYLAFTFRANNSVTGNFTINVPFRLLNLTLGAPITQTPLQYFPCSLPNLEGYRLGRAFLQAAFISVNWMTDFHGLWFLAQAPGPNLAHDPGVADIGPTDRTIRPSENTWLDSWQGFWAEIAVDGTQSAQNTPSEPSRPNTGLIVGVTMAAIVIVIGCLAVGTVLLRRRKDRQRGLQANTQNRHPEKNISNGVGVLEHMQKFQIQTPPELTSETAPQELYGSMPVDVRRSFELDANQIPHSSNSKQLGVWSKG